MAFFVYILASKRNGTLYVGSTDSLTKRVWQHREKVHPYCFTARYGVTMLVCCDAREGAKGLERRMKEWRRSWKIRLIEETNPDWNDLYDTLAFS